MWQHCIPDSKLFPCTSTNKTQQYTQASTAFINCSSGHKIYANNYLKQQDKKSLCVLLKNIGWMLWAKWKRSPSKCWNPVNHKNSEADTLLSVWYLFELVWRRNRIGSSWGIASVYLFDPDNSSLNEVRYHTDNHLVQTCVSPFC